MAAVLEAPAVPEAPVASTFRDYQRFVLADVNWATYEAFVAVLDGRPGLRLTYDGEHLELMTLSSEHEFSKEMLGRLIQTLTFVLSIPIRSGGSMTCKKELVKRGLEPDQCYWVANEEPLRDKMRLDFNVDPPPDLAVEVDISHSSLNRQSIYAALGVSELWRYDGRTLQVFLLDEAGAYIPRESSAAFPFLPVDKLVPFIRLRERTDETTHLRRFAEWVREQDFHVER